MHWCLYQLLVNHGLSALEGALGSWGGLCVSGRTFVTLLMLSGTKKKKESFLLLCKRALALVLSLACFYPL